MYLPHKEILYDTFGLITNIVDSDQAAPREQSNQGLQWLLRHVCPNTSSFHINTQQPIYSNRLFQILFLALWYLILSFTPKGVDYIVIGFDTEVQPLITHNAA